MKKLKYKKNIWIIKLEEPNLFSSNFRFYRSHLLAEKLLQRNNKVTFFSSTYDHNSKSQVKINKSKIKNFKYVFLEGRIKYKNSYFLKILNEFISGKDFIIKAEKIKKRPDLIVINIPSIIVANEVAKFCKKFNIKYIIDYRDLHPDIILSEFSWYWKIFLMPFILILKKNLKKICNGASGLVGISKFFQNYLVKLNQNNSNIPNKTFPISYKPVHKIKFNKSNKAKSYKSIIFFGQINNVFIKAFDTFFLNYNYDPNIKIFIVGKGRKLKIFEKKIFNKKNIIYLGNLNQKKLINLYKTMDAMIYLIDNRVDYLNSLPNKFFEAIYYKLPIISYNKGLVKEIINKYKLGLYCDNYNSLKKKINQNEAIFQNFNSSRHEFLKEFSYKKIYKDYSRFIERI